MNLANKSPYNHNFIITKYDHIQMLYWFLPEMHLAILTMIFVDWFTERFYIYRLYTVEDSGQNKSSNIYFFVLPRLKCQVMRYV